MGEGRGGDQKSSFAIKPTNLKKDKSLEGAGGTKIRLPKKDQNIHPDCITYTCLKWFMNVSLTAVKIYLLGNAHKIVTKLGKGGDYICPNFS